MTPATTPVAGKMAIAIESTLFIFFDSQKLTIGTRRTVSKTANANRIRILWAVLIKKHTKKIARNRNARFTYVGD